MLRITNSRQLIKSVDMLEVSQLYIKNNNFLSFNDSQDIFGIA